MDAFIFFTLKSSFCLSAGYLLYWLLLRRETFHRVKRFVLLGIIFISLVVPLIKLRVDPAGMNPVLQKLESTVIGDAPAVAPEQKPAQFPLQRKESNPVNLLTLVYIAGACIQVFLIFFSLARIILLLGKSKKIKYQELRLTLIPSNVVPFCFGRRIIISEKDFREHGREIILHEHTHVKEGHFLDLLISECYLVMTWYNPVSWLIRHEMKQNHEFEADYHVLRQGIDESDYQLLLVRTVAGEPRYALANQFNQSNIKTRITMMNKRKSNPLTALKVLAFIPLIALAVQVFAQKEIKKTNASRVAPSHGKYLELAPDQLKLLGFEMNTSGLFYKNIRFGKTDKGILCLYFTGKTYSASIVLRPGEVITGNSAAEKILKKQALTNFDFYPVVVASFNGFRTLDMSAAETNPNQELLPVQVNMADMKTGKRQDTLVFWFKPTESLKQVLYPHTKIDIYLQPCPPDAREAGVKAKSH